MHVVILAYLNLKYKKFNARPGSFSFKKYVYVREGSHFLYARIYSGSRVLSRTSSGIRM